jgi:lauroyl/myristoyl acyltransferase
MRQVIRSFKTRFTEAAGFGGFFFWRGLDRCLGIGGMFLVARGYYFCRATLNEISKRPEPPRPEPAWLRMGGSLRSRIRRRRQRYVVELLKNFPDRMAEPRWRALCRLEGAEHLEAARQAARQAGRPVVLVFVHLGPIYIMRQWTRAFGFAAAAYVGGDLESRGRVTRFQDRLTPFPEVPVVFFPGEVRALIKFLQAGNILFMAVDLREGQRTTVATDDGWITHLNTGAARLANLTGADLMIATTVNEDWNRFRIKISQPIAGEQLPTEKEWAEANRRLLATLLPDIKAHPEQFVLPMLWEQLTPPIKAGEATQKT